MDRLVPSLLTWLQAYLRLIKVKIVSTRILSWWQGPGQCSQCAHVQDGPNCVAHCPQGMLGEGDTVIWMYPDRVGQCQFCHQNCTQGWVIQVRAYGLTQKSGLLMSSEFLCVLQVFWSWTVGMHWVNLPSAHLGLAHRQHFQQESVMDKISAPCLECPRVSSTLDKPNPH